MPHILLQSPRITRLHRLLIQDAIPLPAPRLLMRRHRHINAFPSPYRVLLLTIRSRRITAATIKLAILQANIPR